MVERFGEGQLDEYVDWLDKHPTGYVWNESKSTLHLANCRHLRRFATRQSHGEERIVKKKVGAGKYAVKKCALTKEELLTELPEAKAEKARCSACDP